MKRNELMNKYIEKGELPLDVAGQIAMLGDKDIIRAMEKGEISRDLAGLLISMND